MLGSGGWFASEDRETCAALIIYKGHATIIDAGSGTRRLLENPELLQHVNEIDVLFTHLHLDHIGGLSSLKEKQLGIPLRFWGPQAALAVGTHRSKIKLRAPHRVRTLLASRGYPITELAPGAHQIGPWRVNCRIQETHTTPSLAYRFDDALVWCTDTAYDRKNIIFAKGVDILAHEAFFLERSPRAYEGHSSAYNAGAIAHRAGAERLLLTHINPLQDDPGELVTEAARIYPGAKLAYDLQRIDLRAPGQ